MSSNNNNQKIKEEKNSYNNQSQVINVDKEDKINNQEIDKYVNKEETIKDKNNIIDASNKWLSCTIM